MESARIAAFLGDAGYAYEVDGAGEVKQFKFKDRGCTFLAIANEDPQFLHLVARFQLGAKRPDRGQLVEILLDLQNEYPVVKLHSPCSEKESYFDVAAEQFEVDTDAIRAVFWRTLDVMRAVADECYRRLDPKPPDNGVPQDETSEYVADLESALQRGCGQPEAEGAPTGIDAIQASLALAVDAEGSTGSAFCIGSTDDASLYVTNAHVVGDCHMLTLYRQEPAYEKMIGTVVALGDPETVDLAIVSVPVPRVPSAAMALRPPRPGMPIAIAGYPRVQIWAAGAGAFGELKPAIHVGTVTAVNGDGSCILHDALSRPGSSGSPLFDPVTGQVYGIQRGGWESEEEAIAVGANALATFLAGHGMTHSTGTPAFGGT